MKIGSLFDGIGGFPLSAVMCGAEPVWASEIEPFPILTTCKRFPSMKHLGSVTEINGAKIEPVDIITFGSPCQDLSVAGKQAGIHEGERSNLFFEAVRIIKEMREHDRRTGRTDEHLRPRFAVWENVPGAFSSNKGADFQAVLQALAEVVDSGVSIPLPEKGKWRKAGGIVGDGYSIAWRVYDAQFWGVPQRRKRIYLIADFGSERAGEILFKREGVCRDTAQSGNEGQGTAENVEGSVGRSGGTWCVKGFDAYQHHNWRESETLGTLTTAGASVRGDTPLVVSCDLYALEGNGSRDSHKGNGWKETDIMFTLNTIERHAVVYEPKSALEENWSESTVKNALRASASTVSHAVVFDQQRFGQYGCGQTASSLKARDYKDATDLVCYDMTHANDVIRECQNVTPTLQHRMGTGGNQVPIKVDIGTSPRKYIVRRLTPLECCRLQGYPDGWTENLSIPDPTDEELSFFTKVWADWSAINGTKPKTTTWVRKWLADPQSDSAEYKAYGNSLAIPCAYDVIRRVVDFCDREKSEAGH